MEMENIADKVDDKDSCVEGSSNVSQAYAKLGRPYMQEYSISSQLTYQFIMSPLMSTLLAEADFMETDTTYNENSELPYLFNATVFDYTTMRWAAVACMRSNKEDAIFYKKAFELTFHYCGVNHSHFKVGETLKGVVMDWSDTEAKGLREVIGAEMAERILRGCNVHWARSYQRVAARVNKAVNQSHYQLAVEAFCLVARQISI